ncbi:TetR/AcrR family transcriptional regulator [Nonomuraea sp. NPDC050547]|uniref:TetR/AcrR family transcriptional regulator n=1 Tax=unclassified Nonomuraea TaxID=2593643 RepID=UPI0037888065
MERDLLLRKVATALANDLSVPLGDLAARAGVGRTTLHRAFPTREILQRDVARFAVAEVARIYDRIGLDDDPVEAVLEKMGDEVLDLAVAFTLLWAEPPITALADLHAEAETQDERFARFAARGQAEGSFRKDVPDGWIGYSIGAQALALFYAVRSGFVGGRAVKRLFVTTVMGGVGVR